MAKKDRTGFFTGLHQTLPEDVRNKLVIKVVETKTRTMIDKCLEFKKIHELREMGCTGLYIKKGTQGKTWFPPFQLQYFYSTFRVYATCVYPSIASLTKFNTVSLT